MDYLFFDIECARNDKVRGAAICSFGYVLTDETFAVVEQKDLLVNPECAFQKRVLHRILSYPESDFLAAPKFYRVFPKIKALLTRPNTLIVGHAVQNDVRFLLDEQTRCGMTPIDFLFIDSQKLFSTFTDRTDNVGLDDMCSQLGLPEKPKKHRSDEDAFCTMLAVKEMCARREVNLSQLVATTKYCTGSIFGGEIKLDAPPKKPLRLSEMTFKNNLIKGKNLNLYLRFLQAAKCKGLQPKTLAGENVYLDREYTETHFVESVKLVQCIVDRGGNIAMRSEADIAVTDREFKGGKEGATVMRFSEFFEKLGLTEDAFCALPLPSVDLNSVPKKPRR